MSTATTLLPVLIAAALAAGAISGCGDSAPSAISVPPAGAAPTAQARPNPPPPSAARMLHRAIAVWIRR